jgi:hypothetical protein
MNPYPVAILAPHAALHIIGTALGEKRTKAILDLKNVVGVNRGHVEISPMLMNFLL